MTILQNKTGSIFLIILLMVTGILSKSLAQEKHQTVTDIDGNVYKTVAIGEQEWMTENLKATRYNDGTPIPNVTDITEWRNSDAPAYVWYDNDISHKDIYGALYNGHAVTTNKELCPAGWRIARDEDWKKLEMFMGMSSEQANGIVWRGDNEGGKLKEAGTEKWSSPNKGATNESGLTIIPSGRRDSSGKFYDMTTGSTIWTSTETSISCAYYRHFSSTNECIGRNPNGDKKFGFATRCIKK
ncbi:fibrobacter succinogenes major paralogous domain-containing protein [Mariniphaga sediminis]|nr:fibrobacter succinogenes major paralogous domain-containing protein [Mariniphaga sediminis]